MGRMEKSLFGILPEGREVHNFTLFDERGQSAVLSEFGCTILEINVRDGEGSLRDVALGYDRLEDYEADTRCFGATVGRYANRIADGMFTLNGITYRLPRNEGTNTLHGGKRGFRRPFSSKAEGGAVVFSLESPDGEEGFPGNLDVRVTVTFSEGRLRMEYRCHTDRDTPVSITNHNYFNLNGHGAGTILNHEVSIRADRFSPLLGGADDCGGDSLLAKAPPISARGTPFDLRGPRTVFEGLCSGDAEILRARGGYDHCFEIAPGGTDEPVATAVGDRSGIRLEVRSNLPALQFYTGNQIGHVRGKRGAVYNTFDGFAMECQQFPNAMNEPVLPSPILRAGETQTTFIEYQFL